MGLAAAQRDAGVGERDEGTGGRGWEQDGPAHPPGTDAAPAAEPRQSLGTEGPVVASRLCLAPAPQDEESEGSTGDGLAQDASEPEQGRVVESQHRAGAAGQGIWDLLNPQTGERC